MREQVDKHLKRREEEDGMGGVVFCQTLMAHAFHRGSNKE